MDSNTSRRNFLVGVTLTLPATSYSRVLGANDRIGIGVIGFGLIGKKHVSTFRTIDQCSIVAMSDVHRGRLAEGIAAAGSNPTGYSDFRKLLDDKRVEGVIVATPDHWHAPMTMLACAAGKDVYVEKPMTLFVREGEWVNAVAGRTKRIVQVGTQQRSGRHYQKARELIRGGHIGKVTSIRISHSRNIVPGFGRPPDGEPPADLDWNLWLGPSPLRKYNSLRGIYHFRWFWDTAGGQMTNLTSHELDIVDWILGLDSLTGVASIGGRFVLNDLTETPDTQDTLFRLKDFTVSSTIRECSLGPPRFGTEFFGTKGSLAITRRGFTVTADPDEPPEARIPGIQNGHPVGGPKAAAISKTGKRRTTPIDDQSGESDEQYREHAHNFLECIRSRKQPISDSASGHRVATACHLANMSLRLGRMLTWNADTNLIADDAEANKQLTRPYRTPWDRELSAIGVG
jgi:predicted dehydrogenase